jgi:hypothetical protein
VTKRQSWGKMGHVSANEHSRLPGGLGNVCDALYATAS